MRISARCVATLMMMMNTPRHGLAVTMTIVGDGSTIGVLISAGSVVLKNNLSGSIVEFIHNSGASVILSRFIWTDSWQYISLQSLLTS